MESGGVQVSCKQALSAVGGATYATFVGVADAVVAEGFVGAVAAFGLRAGEEAFSGFGFATSVSAAFLKCLGPTHAGVARVALAGSNLDFGRAACALVACANAVAGARFVEALGLVAGECFVDAFVGRGGAAQVECAWVEVVAASGAEPVAVACARVCVFVACARSVAAVRKLGSGFGGQKGNGASGKHDEADEPRKRGGPTGHFFDCWVCVRHRSCFLTSFFF